MAVETPVQAMPAPHRSFAHGSREKGRQAHQKGEPRSSCPYLKHGRARTEWLAGWWEENANDPDLAQGRIATQASAHSIRKTFNNRLTSTRKTA